MYGIPINYNFGITSVNPSLVVIPVPTPPALYVNGDGNYYVNNDGDYYSQGEN